MDEPKKLNYTASLHDNTSHPNEIAKWLPYGNTSLYRCSGCWATVRANERTIRCPNCDRKMAYQIVWL